MYIQTFPFIEKGGNWSLDKLSICVSSIFRYYCNGDFKNHSRNVFLYDNLVSGSRRYLDV